MPLGPQHAFNVGPLPSRPGEVDDLLNTLEKAVRQNDQRIVFWPKGEDKASEKELSKR